MSEPPDEPVPPTGPESLAIDFDQYVEQHGIQDHELPQAFAAWLHGQTHGGWHGQVRQVLDDQDHADERSVSGQYGPTADYGDDHSDRPIDG